MFGYESARDLLSHNVVEIWADRADRSTMLARLKEERVLSNYEVRLRKKDGTPIWVLANMSLFEQPGEGVTIQGTLLDITERKRLCTYAPKLSRQRRIAS